MKKSTLVQLLIILFIVGGYFLIDFNALMQNLQGKKEFVTQKQECNLHKEPCSIKLPDGTTYTLEVFPKPIPLMQKLQIKVSTSQPVSKALQLKLYATNMYMGEFLFDLKEEKANNYSTFATLPTCPIGNMQWHLDLSQKDSSNNGARFQFVTER